ncbi:ABC transporter permease [Hoylesella buccalis]|uniref:Transport permease protein n=1 Tax=Hoylesella buccalis DNF00853 TaxID=1401074 RepID=A0A096BNR9_9BACT|nr:ABC transporter permease [Hoylesella buccalis]KGF34814.1 multidrug ABC transporter permease [Hoylesella buccalis DNF00853]
MNQFNSFVIKETKHIMRDRRTMLILFGMPVVMMLVFGFAITTDIKDVKVAIVTSSMDSRTQQVVHSLDASGNFIVTHTVGTTKEAKQLLSDNKVNMAIAFSPVFGNNRYSGQAGVQFIADYTDPNIAEQQVSYAQQIVMDELTREMHGESWPAVNTQLLYNPQMKSAYNFVPGTMGMLMMLICAMMTSVSIVREKERGTMEVLLVSPVKPLYIMIAKAVPYFVLSIMILISILLISKFILAVPIAGNVALIFGVSLLYILLSLALGLLISVVANTQVVALLMSGMLLMMPSTMLSGMIYPIESMPAILRYLSAIIPARWYVSAMKKLMIMGVDVQMVYKELAVLTAMAVVLLAVALKKFKIRLS